MSQERSESDHIEDEYVRLKQDIPFLGLHSGDIGIICSKWFLPDLTYEVEFEPEGLSHHTRVLLLSEQIETRAGTDTLHHETR